MLLVDKPRNWTSRQAVVAVKRSLQVRKAGHAGTLDPLATGLLVICLGRGTLLSRHLTGQDKSYIATARLGMTTDTYDITGAVISRKDCSKITEKDIKSALMEFVGEIEQVPPLYSAVKYKGRPLYKYAREGKEVEVKPRQVSIYEASITEFRSEYGKAIFDMEMKCSSGTYVRSLVHDIGEKLGCGATVESLTRTRSGQFRLEDAVSLSGDVEHDPDYLRKRILGLEEATEEITTVIVNKEAAVKIAHGKPLEYDWVEADVQFADGEVFRVLGEHGNLIAIYRNSRSTEYLGKAVRVICPASLTR